MPQPEDQFLTGANDDVDEGDEEEAEAEVEIAALQVGALSTWSRSLSRTDMVKFYRFNIGSTPIASCVSGKTKGCQA